MPAKYLLRIIAACSISIIAFAFAPAFASAGDGALTIMYTGAIRGELEPCGCSPETQSGGLARLSEFVKSQKGKGDLILIDAGNSMPDDTPQGRLKAQAIVRSFIEMGYGAAAFFKKDMSFHEDASRLSKDKLFTVTAGSKPKRIERGPFKINISADPAAHEKGMLNILLTERKSSSIEPDGKWDIIITSSGENIEEPLVKGDAAIISGYPKGQKLGILKVRPGKKGKPEIISHRWQTLGNDIKDDERVRSILNEYDREVAELMKAEEEKSAHPESPYLGAKSCIDCHQPFAEQWMGTKHSGAFATLEKRGKSKDPECVKCHVTGYADKGFISITATPELAGVQCEACHGPGKEHVKDFRPMRPVNEAVCVTCHTQDNSPRFDYKTYHERIAH